MYCTNCGAEIADNAAVCINCGVAVGTEKKFCKNCGCQVNSNQVICVNCGCALQMPQANRAFAGGAPGQQKKMISHAGTSATTATILSCLIPGLGQICLGQTVKGIAILIGGSLLSFVSMGILGIPIWIIAMIDANKIGKKLEAGESVGEWDFF
jgi:TM2 domain-containing membrane protein YozV